MEKHPIPKFLWLQRLFLIRRKREAIFLTKARLLSDLPSLSWSPLFCCGELLDLEQPSSAWGRKHRQEEGRL